ncbi:MAG: hypothetical protein MK209_06390 [Planctomycetes bacterium]|nr:hypothetical protein [Planctomycetota bacterium]
MSLIVASNAQTAEAQQTNLTPAATTPGDGRIYPESKFLFFSRDGAGDVLELEQRLTYGFGGHSASWLEVPYNFDEGLGDASIGLKHRFLQVDSGSVDTLRAAIYGGVELPTGEELISTDSVNPFAGATLTSISGRFGWNAAVTAHVIGNDAPIKRSPKDVGGTLVHSSGSLAWRVAPVEYGSDFVAASYLVLDANAHLGGSGNTEAWLSPGLLYEAPDFAIELSFMVPVSEDVEGRPERDYGVLAGLRLLF